MGNGTEALHQDKGCSLPGIGLRAEGTEKILLGTHAQQRGRGETAQASLLHTQTVFPLASLCGSLLSWRLDKSWSPTVERKD